MKPIQIISAPSLQERLYWAKDDLEWEGFHVGTGDRLRFNLLYQMYLQHFQKDPNSTPDANMRNAVFFARQSFKDQYPDDR